MNNFPRMHLWQNIFLIILILNIIILDIFVFSGSFKNQLMPAIIQNQTNKVESIIIPEVTKQTPLSITPSVTKAPAFNQTIINKPLIRELYIPIGSGSSKSSNWKALEGVEINIDTTKYSTIKEAYFQASLRIPTANGRVYAKLVNETDKHDVWFSEVSNEGSIAVVKEAKIDLASGAKLYRVYLKSTLESEAILDQARIKLIVEE